MLFNKMSLVFTVSFRPLRMSLCHYRVIRPPGGASTIFDEADAAAAAANGERNVVTPERHVNYKMRSNFELGDEQPAPPPASAAQQQRRRSKPSGEIPVDFPSENLYLHL